MQLDTVLTPDVKQAIEATVMQTRRWEPESVAISLVVDWPHDRLPLLAASHKQLRTDLVLLFAVLPDKSVVSQFAEDSFARIVNAAFKDVRAEDQGLLVKLGNEFRHFGNPIGRAITTFPGHKVPADRLPRKEPGPVYKTQGDDTVIAFYSYDYNQMLLYDCKMVFHRDQITLTSRLLE